VGQGSLSHQPDVFLDLLAFWFFSGILSATPPPKRLWDEGLPAGLSPRSLFVFCPRAELCWSGLHPGLVLRTQSHFIPLGSPGTPVSPIGDSALTLPPRFPGRPPPKSTIAANLASSDSRAEALGWCPAWDSGQALFSTGLNLGASLEVFLWSRSLFGRRLPLGLVSLPCSTVATPCRPLLPRVVPQPPTGSGRPRSSSPSCC